MAGSRPLDPRGCYQRPPVVYYNPAEASPEAGSRGTGGDASMKMIAHRFQASVAGLSAESIVVIVAAGLVLGVFPVYGCPTLLCMLAALVFRINLPAIQLVNQVCSPLQLALWIPLHRVGA